MKDPIKLSERISAGGQPTEEDLTQLVKGGFRSIVNLPHYLVSLGSAAAISRAARSAPRAVKCIIV